MYMVSAHLVPLWERQGWVGALQVRLMSVLGHGRLGCRAQASCRLLSVHLHPLVLSSVLGEARPPERSALGFH